MHASGWVELVRTIPAEYHDGMSLVLQNGLELNVQAFLRLDEQYMVLRGRAMGSMDSGLTFFVPYDQIACLAYLKSLKAEVVLPWFRDPPAFPRDALEARAPVAVPAPTPAAVPEPGPTVPGQPVVPATPAAAASKSLAAPTPVPMSTSMALPAKTAMIERLRKRALGTSAQGTTPKPPPEK